MHFNSPLFVLSFVLIAIVLRTPLTWMWRKGLLVLASLIFYCTWSPEFLPILLLTILVDQRLALLIDRLDGPLARRALCVTCICFNLGLLIYFKYHIFVCNAFINALHPWTNLETLQPSSAQVIPLGISFYTFESICYIVEVYQRKTKPARSLIDYALFISFFPHLLAGPIVRPGSFLAQLSTPRLPNGAQLGWGATLFILGLFQKCVLADPLGVIADKTFFIPATSTSFDQWIGTLAFGMQIYCDFAGYTTSAIGLALMLGFVLTENFRSPYSAMGMTDFWRRWHISLSTWLRDHLFIPLGGSRLGLARTTMSLMVTMVLGGLWHGAAWNFIVWGAIHGLALAIEHGFRSTRGTDNPLRGPIWAGLTWLTTFVFVMLTWVIFRAHDLHDAAVCLAKVTGVEWAPGLKRISAGEVFHTMTVVTLVLCTHLALRTQGTVGFWAALPWWGRSILLAGLTSMVLLTRTADRTFIYFQF